MPEKRFKPHVTVATVVENDGKYLLVEEERDGKIVINQPAGHIEHGESLAEAAVREVIEETAWKVELTGVLSLGLYTSPTNNITYFRTTFLAKPVRDTGSPLDEGIIKAVWLSPEELRLLEDKMRSPMVIQAINAHQSGTLYPLDLIQDCH